MSRPGTMLRQHLKRTLQWLRRVVSLVVRAALGRKGLEHGWLEQEGRDAEAGLLRPVYSR